MKRMLCALAALALMILTLGTAAAGAGDRTILMLGGADFFASGSLQNLIPAGGKYYLFISSLSDQLMVYDPDTGNAETWDLQDLEDRMLGSTPEAISARAEADAEEEEGTRQESIACWFGRDDGIYALVVRSRTQENSSQVEGAVIRRLKLSDGKADLEDCDFAKPDWSGMTETSGSWESSRYIADAGCAGDRLYLMTYDDGGTQIMMICDLQTGEMEERILPDVDGFQVQEDGKLLTSGDRFGEKAEKIYSLYDPETESQELVASFDLDEGNVSDVAWDPKTETLYYCRNGEIHVMPDRDPSRAAAVNDAPEAGRTFGRVTEKGQLLIWGYQGAFLRNTDPALRSQTILRIRPFSWSMALNAAANRFGESHGDISLVTEENGDESTLLQAMMNRDGRVDIYLAGLESSAFRAVYDRGFLADLSENAKLTETVERIYPNMAEVLKKDGKLVAVPVYLSGEGIGFYPAALEKLGMDPAELPKSWEAFLRFLEEELPERLEGKPVSAFESYSYEADLRVTMMAQILGQYTVNHPGEDFDTEPLRSLLERVQKLDLESLGVHPDTEDEEGGMTYYGGEDQKEPLFMSYASYAVSTYEGPRPLPLALAEGEEPVMPFTMTVAFVNPFSEHLPEAETFLETLAESLDSATRYSLFPDQNEPVRNPNFEEIKKTTEKWLGYARANLEKADEEERETWEKAVEEYEQQLENADRDSWLISPDNIAQYRERSRYMKPVTWDPFKAISASEGWDQIWEMRYSYGKGQTGAGELLSYMDKKVRMMRLEGN